jgi:hypothetical protein
MTPSDEAAYVGMRSWFLGCATATAVLFMHGFVVTAVESHGMNFSLHFAGLFIAVVHFTFIAIFTALPASLFLYLVSKLRAQFLIFFVAWGAALGWLGNYCTNPFIRDQTPWQFPAAGAAAGLAAWYSTRRAHPGL